MTRRADFPTIDVAELRFLQPHLLAGARALRERERWACRVAHLPVAAEESAEDAEALERFAGLIDRMQAPAGTA